MKTFGTEKILQQFVHFVVDLKVGIWFLCFLSLNQDVKFVCRFRLERQHENPRMLHFLLVYEKIKYSRKFGYTKPLSRIHLKSSANMKCTEGKTWREPPSLILQ